MCGIVGVIAKSEKGRVAFQNMSQALQSLNKRGPDHQGIFSKSNICFGHARLSIIDTSEAANQPFQDPSQRFTVIFNGEIYNFQQLKKQLEQLGFAFYTQSDTEVLLNLFIAYREKCVDHLNGFFSFAVYDAETKEVFVFRDRLGIKPLVYYEDEDKVIFASENKAIHAFSITKELDKTALFTYLQLNYIPYPKTILQHIKKLPPGHLMRLQSESLNEVSTAIHQYYKIPFSAKNLIDVSPKSYNEAKKTLREKIGNAVEKRLVADVPLGSFLSGGIDSSIIAIEAKKRKSDLQTFSICYPNEPFFDETKYARAVAEKHKINHEVFEIKAEDLYENLHNVLDYLDEPFGDSSCLPVYILSQKTSNKVKVALSGDGADEMFAGYNKHFAEFKTTNPGIGGLVAGAVSPISQLLPQSRNSKLGNLNRKLARFNEGRKLSRKNRYWRWASICDEEEANYYLKEKLIIKEQRLTDEAFNYKKVKDLFTKSILKEGLFNEVLLADMHLVLPNDMLHKVDMMSMANSLEVRTPFLDHELVNYAFKLPSAFKINNLIRKKILQGAYKDELPDLLFNRPKQGFEVPLLGWFQGELKSKIEQQWLSLEFIEEQGIFNPEAIQMLKTRLFSKNPGEAVGTTWDLIVFQNWYLKYFLS